MVLILLLGACDRSEESSTPAETEAASQEQAPFALDLPDSLRGESFRSLDQDRISTVVVRDDRRFDQCDACDVAIFHSRGPSPGGTYVNDLDLSSDAAVVRATEEELRVDDQWVVSITDGAFADAHVQTLILQPLFDALEDTRRRREAEARLLDTPFETPEAVLFLEPNLSWRSTLILVHTAMQAGFQVGLAHQRTDNLFDLEVACFQQEDDVPLFEGGDVPEPLGPPPTILLCRRADPNLPDIYGPVSITLWQVGALQEIGDPPTAQVVQRYGGGERADRDSQLRDLSPSSDAPSGYLIARMDADGVSLISETTDERIELAVDDIAEAADAWRRDHPDGSLRFSATDSLPTGEVQKLLDTLLFDGDTPRFPSVILALHQ